MHPSVTPGTSLPYNFQPWNGVAMDNTEDTEVLGSIHTREDEGYTHQNEDIQTYLDKATEMDDTRDVYEEFIDNDGPIENPELLDELQPQNNLNPNPEWFTLNTWDDIDDPSPSLETGLLSWRLGDEPSKGMLFKNKAAV